MQVPIGPDELLGVSSVHSYVPLVVLVEIAPDPDDVFWAARMESEAEADVRDEIVEALLPVESGSRERKGKGPSGLDAEGKGRADVTDRCFGDRPKAGCVGPPFTPGGQAPVGGGFPSIHPDRQHGQEPLVCRECPPTFA